MDYFTNPFDRERDPDRHALWDMIVARDSEAFVTRDWKRVEGDFAADRFECMMAHGSANPRDWKLLYPTLESIRDDWLKEAKEFLELPLADITHRDLIYKSSRLNLIEIAGDRALCHKQFTANERLKNGALYIVACQSLVRAHRIGGRWKIAGGIGYLPLSATPPPGGVMEACS